MSDALMSAGQTASCTVARAHHSLFFFFNDTATTEIYTLSLHDALPISDPGRPSAAPQGRPRGSGQGRSRLAPAGVAPAMPTGPPSRRVAVLPAARPRRCEIGRAHV